MAHVRRHPKSGRWQVRYRDPSGRERSRTFSRKVDADRFAATVVADVVRGPIHRSATRKSNRRRDGRTMATDPTTSRARRPATRTATCCPLPSKDSVP